MTKRSTYLIKEYRNYLWKIDKDGKILNTPEEGNDHLLDATRYGMVSFKPNTHDPFKIIRQNIEKQRNLRPSSI